MNCATLLKIVEGNLATYHVLEELLFGDRTKECMFEVVFNRDNHDVSYEGSLFEFRGILCCHVLCACQNVPVKYVLSRWSKSIKRKHSYIKISYGVAEMKPQMDRFDKLCKHFYEVAEVATESEDSSKELRERLRKIKSNLLSMDATRHNGNKSFNDVSIPNNITIRDDLQITEIRSPLRVTHKGCSRSKRTISVVEKVVQKCRKRTKKNGDKQTTKVWFCFHNLYYY